MSKDQKEVTIRQSIVRGHLTVIESRLNALEAAIRRRDWDDVEFQYDRVLRATQKLRRVTN